MVTLDLNTNAKGHGGGLRVMEMQPHVLRTVTPGAQREGHTHAGGPSSPVRPRSGLYSQRRQLGECSCHRGCRGLLDIQTSSLGGY